MAYYTNFNSLSHQVILIASTLMWFPKCTENLRYCKLHVNR